MTEQKKGPGRPKTGRVKFTAWVEPETKQRLDGLALHRFLLEHGGKARTGALLDMIANAPEEFWGLLEKIQERD